MTIPLNIPDDVAKSLISRGANLAQTVLEAVALEGYRSGRLSEAQVRRLLGYQTRMEVDGFLKDHGIYLGYTVEDLDREGEISRRLWAKRQQELACESEEHRRAG